ncbi:MAG: hypothetical protein RLZZ500_1572 [Bacteroidota bacterium]|jgi:hypothetical protein
MDKSKIALISTVINFELYQKSSPLFPKGIQKYVIDGRNGMHGIHSIHYLFEKLKGKGIEWLIMADEDVLFTQPDLVFSLIATMEQQQYTVCGVRDGGVIAHRNYNPHAINTFFSILNFKVLEKIYTKKEIQKHQYCNPGEFQEDVAALPFAFHAESTFELYYCFYFWLRRQGHRFLFLDSKMESDSIANSIFVNGEKLLTHTWYARSYGVNAKHTERIESFLSQIPTLNEPTEAPILFKKSTFAMQQSWKKLLAKIRHKLVS